MLTPCVWPHARQHLVLLSLRFSDGCVDIRDKAGRSPAAEAKTSLASLVALRLYHSNLVRVGRLVLLGACPCLGLEPLYSGFILMRRDSPDAGHMMMMRKQASQEQHPPLQVAGVYSCHAMPRTHAFVNLDCMRSPCPITVCSQYT